jgi:hypothetical protein
MKSAWVSATAAVFLIAGWAAAQAPGLPPAIIPNSPDPYLVDPPPPSGIPPKLQAAIHGCPFCTWLTAGCLGDEPLPYQAWVSADFLVWNIRSATLPGLASTVPVGLIRVDTVNTFQNPNGTPAGPPQIVENFAPFSIQTASTVAAGSNIDLGEQFGGRFTAGVWLDSESSVGIEGRGFYLIRRTDGFTSTTGNSVNQSVITLPFANNVFLVTPSTATTPGTRTLEQSFTAFVVRQVNSDLTGTASSGMWGGELNVRCVSPSLGAVSGLVGFRYVNLHEDLNVHSTTQFFLPQGFEDVNGAGGPLNTNLPTNLNYTTVDAIGTHNNFYGGQVGLDLDMYVNRFIIDIRGTAALGVMHQTVDVLSGFQLVSVAGTPAVTTVTNGAGGLLSSPLDQGSHSRNVIAFVPEINVKLGYQLLPSLRAYVGYDFMWLSSVARPGEQVGVSSSGIVATVAGTAQQITVNQPSFRFKDSGVTINGINFGVEFRY